MHWTDVLLRVFVAMRRERQKAERWALSYVKLHNLKEWMTLVHARKGFRMHLLTVADVLGRSATPEEDEAAFHAREWARVQKRIGKMLKMPRYLGHPEKVRKYAESRAGRESTLLVWALRAYDVQSLTDEGRAVHQGMLEHLTEHDLKSADATARTFALVA